ncbi:MAG: thioredoxin domain-containing protein [Bryobacteraceae bacterium]|jgi:protein-disulfide isomerase
MLFSSARGILLCVLTAIPLIAQDWQTSQTLPSVDLTGLTSAQKALALKVLRTNSCPCGCEMKMAECRTQDPNCSNSKALASIVVTAIRKGGNEAAVLAAVDASPLMHRAPPKLLEDPVAIPIDGAPFIGPKDARVTLVEFSDFQCPYCAQAVGKLNAILKAYPSQVKLVFKEYPLDMHSQAALAAAAALAAHRQGKFWPLHDAMFADRTHLSRKTILAMAGSIGLDTRRFEQDWDSAAIKQAVANDQTEGDKAGVEATPTVFIDGQKYNGDLDLDSIRPIIDAKLKRK